MKNSQRKIRFPESLPDVLPDLVTARADARSGSGEKRGGLAAVALAESQDDVLKDTKPCPPPAAMHGGDNAL